MTQTKNGACKIPACKSRCTKRCVSCAKPVCKHHAKAWSDAPCCAKCSMASNPFVCGAMPPRRTENDA